MAEGFRTGEVWVVQGKTPRRTAEDVADYLIHQGFEAQYFHGELDTESRDRIRAEFAGGTIDVVLVTRYFAHLFRGLTFPASL